MIVIGLYLSNLVDLQVFGNIIQYTMDLYRVLMLCYVNIGNITKTMQTFKFLDILFTIKRVHNVINGKNYLKLVKL